MEFILIKIQFWTSEVQPSHNYTNVSVDVFKLFFFKHFYLTINASSLSHLLAFFKSFLKPFLSLAAEFSFRLSKHSWSWWRLLWHQQSTYRSFISITPNRKVPTSKLNSIHFKRSLIKVISYHDH